MYLGSFVGGVFEKLLFSQVCQLRTLIVCEDMNTMYGIFYACRMSQNFESVMTRKYEFFHTFFKVTFRAFCLYLNTRDICICRNVRQSR